jgi:hypothetical protein
MTPFSAPLGSNLQSTINWTQLQLGTDCSFMPSLSDCDEDDEHIDAYNTSRRNSSTDSLGLSVPKFTEHLQGNLAFKKLYHVSNCLNIKTINICHWIRIETLSNNKHALPQPIINDSSFSSIQALTEIICRGNILHHNGGFISLIDKKTRSTGKPFRYKQRHQVQIAFDAADL